MRILRSVVRATPLLLAVAGPAQADTTEVTHETPVVVGKSGGHCARRSELLQPLSSGDRAGGACQPGQIVVIETRDAFDSNLNLQSTAEDVTALDLNLVHPMTGRSMSKARCVATCWRSHCSTSSPTSTAIR